MSNETERVMKTIPTKKSPDPDGITDELYWAFKEEHQCSSNYFKNTMGRNSIKLIL
jgi:hypothetical protein